MFWMIRLAIERLHQNAVPVNDINDSIAVARVSYS